MSSITGSTVDLVVYDEYSDLLDEETAEKLRSLAALDKLGRTHFELEVDLEPFMVEYDDWSA
jgi:hypothetical protein